MVEVCWNPFDASNCAGCPVAALHQEAADEHEQQQALQLQLASWSQLGELLAWFATAVLPADAAARLSFAACLPKEARAGVHTLVSKKHGKVCQSVSGGFGAQRHVAVLAKAAASTRQLSSEHQDHALALWYLYKQQSKQQMKQQQQQQQPPQPANDNSPQPQLHAQFDAGAQAAADLSNGVDALQLAAAPQARQYSRDEVAQMMAQGQLTDDLAALWASPAGEAQRLSRLLCLASSAGDAQQAQEITAANPSLAPSSVMDLSSGGQLPLHLAAAAGSLDVLQLLLAAGADVEARNGMGETALQVRRCCQFGAAACLLTHTQCVTWKACCR
ncbi:hypothetical protein COO60DRAFT_538233 [Scenedesmus sp. NREL 46B-D3]|nr:hypothetical protein COO60DRAFT_538233 [Scenedesmus sp. NREL 46B-D3]